MFVEVGAAAEHAQSRVDVVVIGEAAAEVPSATALEGVAAMQHSPVVESDEIARPERVPDLESRIACEAGEDAEGLVRPGDVGWRHVRGAPDRVERPQRERLVR